MKKVKFSNVFWRNIISLLIIGSFIHLAMSTIPGTNQQKFVHPDGRVEIAKTFSKGNKEIITGTPDAYEAWQGPTTIEYQDAFGDRTAFEEVNMIDGYRDGRSFITDSDGRIRVYCYKMGERIDCEKSAIAGHNSPYEIFSYKYPWLTLKFNVSGFSDEYIKAYMDTVETLMTGIEADFEDLYDEADEVLSETHYDSIIAFNGELALYYGVELSKNSEFRRAVLDQQRAKDESTYNIIKNKYPNYLKSLNDFEVSNSDFMAFGTVFDSIMQSNSPLDQSDPYFIDSVDARMYNAITWIYDSEDDDLVADNMMKSLELTSANKALKMFREKSATMTIPDELASSPKEVSEIVLSLMLLNFAQADLLRNSVYEWYSKEHGIAILPTTTTSFVSRNSSSSVTVSGNISDDGGDGISTRGIVWGKGFNPILTDNVITVGDGLGEFETQITGLLDKETYYARSYATNSAGTAYGNCLKFTTNLAVGIETNEMTDNNFNVYPNPASEKITISFKADSPQSIMLSIVNVNGQLVKQVELTNLVQGENNIEINVLNLDNGIYSCSIIDNGEEIISQKLVITH